MAVDGTDLRALTTDKATDQAPAWSHDGRQVLWESYRYGNMEIMAMDAAGGEPRNLTQDTYADDHGGTWSPSGTQIAYFSNRDGGWDIFTLDLRTGARVNLTESVEMEQYPVFHP
jgi:Tol biopolymer transport system component